MDVSRPLRATVGLSPGEQRVVTPQKGVSSDALVPRAAIRTQPLEDMQVPSAGCCKARSPVHRASLLSRPSQDVKVALFRRSFYWREKKMGHNKRNTQQHRKKKNTSAQGGGVK